MSTSTARVLPHRPTPGVHPDDAVTWELRDVVQQNWKTGETIFEQRGVEFPDFWSVNASTIVTTKYFRGAVGTPEREQGLKQLIDRVVLTYVKAGKEHGYFATDADAEAEADEVASGADGICLGISFGPAIGILEIGICMGDVIEPGV